MALSKKTKIILVISAVIGLVATIVFFYQQKKKADEKGTQKQDAPTEVTGGTNVKSLY